MAGFLSLIIFFLFSGAATNPSPAPYGEDVVPGIRTGGRIDCIAPDAAAGSPTIFGIPKPSKENVPFVAKDNPHLGRYNCSTASGACDINPWSGNPIPEVADYVTIASNVVLTKIWPDNDTTRLAKQLLPVTGQPYYQSTFDVEDFRDRMYRPTCNDWCAFTPPERTPALPYGGTFFCDFIFFYQGQNKGGITTPRLYTPRNDGLSANEPYPDDTTCDANNNFENCPIFDILVRKDAVIPENAGGAAPGSHITPLRCDIKDAQPAAQGSSDNNNNFLASKWIETVSSHITAQRAAHAQAETFINLLANHDAQGEWVLAAEKSSISSKMNQPADGRVRIPEPPIAFRGKTYEAYYMLIKGINLNRNLLYLVESGVIDQVDQARLNNNPDFPFKYIEFRRSHDIHPTGKTLQLGTFPVVTAKGWWELFPEESKPAIYLYPEKKTDFNVKLEPKGKLTVSDPHYNPETGWNITAHADGKIFESSSTDFQKFYPYLYYEAILDKVEIKPEGFLVPGNKLRSYFTEELPKMGLTKLETADFIQYWMGRLDEKQPYYFIHYLSQEQIEDLEPITLTQLNKTGEKSANIIPDTEIRIRPYFKPLSVKEAGELNPKPQSIPEPPERKGFILVEWGGILVD